VATRLCPGSKGKRAAAVLARGEAIGCDVLMFVARKE